MINSFEIENFRLFDKLKIYKFGRVNLIVGKNNVGKSALLEALVLFFSKASRDEIINFIGSRQENWAPITINQPRSLNIHSIRHLFNGHKIPKVNSNGIKLFSKEEESGIEIKTAVYVLEERDAGVMLKRIEPDEIDNYDLDSLQYHIVSEYDGKTVRILPLQDDIRSQIRVRSLFSQVQKESLPYQFVPTQGINDRKASILWDGISLTPLEKEVVNGLKILEPSVAAIAFVGDENGRIDIRGESRIEKRIPLVKLEVSEEPIPLKSLGDGMSRVFQIILSLVNSSNGVLLVDEFENGLHWSVQEKVWKTVFELSEKLNVQVFATTHSTDCIHTFQKVWETDENAGAFIRLSKKGEEIVATEYDLELLKDSVETDVEVR